MIAVGCRGRLEVQPKMNHFNHEQYMCVCVSVCVCVVCVCVCVHVCVLCLGEGERGKVKGERGDRGKGKGLWQGTSTPVQFQEPSRHCKFSLKILGS